jgi:hypothetical protein
MAKGTIVTKKMAHQPCWICTNLKPFDLVELDRILGDPLCWPRTIWTAMGKPPVGGLPYSYRRYGALGMGREWLMSHGYEYPDGAVGKMRLYRHFRNHVPLHEVDVDELIRSGIIAPMKYDKDVQLAAPLDPLAYISFYNDGIKAGLRALGLLSNKVQALIDANEEVPLPLLKMLLDAGLKLSASQAGIKASGKPFGDDDHHENEAFRGGDDISPRFADVHVREIDGESRPVADGGPAERKRGNERARQEGGSLIGGR